MGEYFCYAGKHALCVYDDLTKQADAYRQMSLLIRRPPGREAFPGDVFYLHSPPARARRQARPTSSAAARSRRCRSSRRRPATCRPTSRRTSSRSPTARSSSSRTSSSQGVRPAINVGISVSRVGSNAQTQGDEEGRRPPASWTSRSSATWRPSRSSAPTSTRPRSSSSSRGQRMVATLNQPQYDPWPIEEQVVASSGPPPTATSTTCRSTEVAALQRRACASTCAAERDVLEAIRDSGDLSDETVEER